MAIETYDEGGEARACGRRLMMKKTKKGKWIALGIVLFLVLALGVFLLVWYFGASFPVYDAVKREEASIPGLKEGISPQGLCALPENDAGYDFAMSGYMTDGTASRVYLIDNDAGETKFITVTKEGAELTTHFGGIACSGNYLMIASGKSVVRLALDEVLAAENGAGVEITDSFQTDINNAYCYYAADRLYVGEFYRAGNYETAESHRITKDGETNYAFIYVYEADEGAEGGISSATPLQVISVRGLVQGIAVWEDGIVLSTSYGLPSSHLYVYENILNGAAEGTAVVNGEDAPLYRLDSSNLINTVTAPCMSEEICISNGRLYVLYESLCNKYKYFVRTRIDRIHSIALSDLK